MIGSEGRTNENDARNGSASGSQFQWLIYHSARGASFGYRAFSAWASYLQSETATPRYPSFTPLVGAKFGATRFRRLKRGFPGPETRAYVCVDGRWRIGRVKDYFRRDDGLIEYEFASQMERLESLRNRI